MREKRLPPWFKVKLEVTKEFANVRRTIKEGRLHTVCESARCPNVWECWRSGTATFMILGNVCTRSCGFCAVENATPAGVDYMEAERVADAVARLKINYAVVTSVTRDDLPDGGALLFAQTIREIRKKRKGCRIEVLIPDFRGMYDPLKTVIEAGPDVLNHNLETVWRLYDKVRPQASYKDSLLLLKRAKSEGAKTKTGIMVGFGESTSQLYEVFEDINKAGCDILSIGQYLQPDSSHLPVERFYTPEEFEKLGEKAKEAGIAHVEASPLTRSSYHAERYG